MIRPFALLFFFSLFSRTAWAGVAVDLNYGHSISGTFNTGKSVPATQSSFALSMDYVSNLSRGLLGTGAERYGLGLGLYLAQVSYAVGETKNTGGNFFVTARTNWLILVANKNWLVQLTPEFVLFSRLTAASYSQTTIDGENAESASVSTYSGNGSIRLPLYLGKKLSWKLGKADLYFGGSLAMLLQNFSKRQDAVAATSPSTGKVTTLEKSSQGSYALQVISIQFHLTFLM